MKKNIKLAQLLILLVFVLFIWATVNLAYAQQQRGQQRRGQQQADQQADQQTDQQPTAPAKPEELSIAIPDNKRPWAGLPWIAGAALTLITVLVSFKNAKRSHLD